jgi:hypothetical protein
MAEFIAASRDFRGHIRIRAPIQAIFEQHFALRVFRDGLVLSTRSGRLDYDEGRFRYNQAQ